MSKKPFIVKNGLSANGTTVIGENGKLHANNTITSGTIRGTHLENSGTPTGTFGSSSKVPVITVDSKGRITNISNTNVAGVTGFTYSAANNNLRISTADGMTFDATIAQAEWDKYMTVANTQSLVASRLGATASVALTGDVTGSASFSSNSVSITTDISNSGVTAGSYGSASAVPVFTVAADGRITSASTTAVAGVTGFTYTAANNNLRISTATGTTFDATIPQAEWDNYMSVANTQALANARLGSTASISLTGDVSGSGSFSSNSVTITTTVADDSHNHIISNVDGLQTALNTKATWAELISTNTSIRSAISSEVAALVDSAPTTLNTLNELAAALGDNPNFATTLTTNLGQKLGATASISLTGDVSGSGSFSSNSVSITTTVANDSHTHDGRYYTETETNTLLDNKMSVANTQALANARLGSAASVTLTGAVTGSGSFSGNSVSITTTATSDPTITLAGDLTGSVTLTNLGNGTLTATVVDDSHNHIIGNVDGLQAALDNKMSVANTQTLANARLGATASVTLTGDVTGTASFSSNSVSINTTVADDSHNHVISNVDGLQAALDNKMSVANTQTLANARLGATAGITLTGAVTGTGSFSGNSVSITTTATSDPTLTLAGDVSGSATFTNLGNATLTATVADDSHNHIISNVDGLQTALDGKVDLAGDTMTGDLTIATSAGPTLTVKTTAGSSYDAAVVIAGARTGSSTSEISAVRLRNETASAYDLARIIAYDPSGNHASGNGKLVFKVSNGGTLADQLTILNTGAATFAGDLTVSGGDIILGGTGRIQGIDTVSAGTDAANKTYVDTAVANLVDSAPATLDTLNELAAALGDNPNFATTVATNLGQKLGATASVTLTGAVTGSGSFSGNTVSISTTATSDPTITLAGDLTGSVTLTNLGNGTLTASVVDDSHTHDGRYFTETESDARYVRTGAASTMSGKLTLTGGGNDADPTSSINPALQITSGSIYLNHDEALIVFDEGQKMITSNDSQGNFHIIAGSGNDATHISSSSGNSGLAKLTFNTDGTDGAANISIGPARSAGSSAAYDYGLAIERGVSGLKWCTGSSTTYASALATKYTIWHSGNDGSGSGLDADLLDGQQGSYYLNTSTTFGGDVSGTYNAIVVADDSHNHIIGNVDGLQAALDAKLASSSYTAADVLTKIKTVDGSGSGLDADLLDGKDHTKFGATLATYGSASGASGRIRCTAPFNTNSAHMFQVTVSIYSSYTQHTYVVGGYMYPSTNQWHAPTCVYYGTGTPDIVVGRDANGRAYISIANGNYTGVRVHNMTLGYQTSLSDTYDPWTITIDGATENSVTPTVSKVWTSGNGGSGSGLDADLLDGQQGSSYLRSNVSATNTVDLRAPIFYDSNDTAYYADPASTSNINAMQMAGPLRMYAGGYEGSILFGSNSTWRCGIRQHDDADAELRIWAKNAGGMIFLATGYDGEPASIARPTNGLVIQNNNVGIGNFSSSDPAYDLHVADGGIGYASGSFRAPIFYDSNDTAWYINPASTSITDPSGKFRQYVQIGDSASYNSNDGSWGARLNVTDNIHAKITVGQDANAMLSHWFAHTGHTSIKIGTSTAHDVEIQRGSTTQLGAYNGYALAHNQMRSPIFYDSNNTAYYGNFASDTSIVLNGMIKYGATNAESQGGFVGRHTDGLATDIYPSPIYCIGTNYRPSGTGLSNMYGVGYAHTNASFYGLSGQSGWGFYVAADGDARVQLNGGNGAVSCTGQVVAYASDGRLKKNVTTITNALEKLSKIRGVTYDWVDDITTEYDFHPSKMHEVGVIAQEVQEVLPEIITEAPFNSLYTAKTGWKKIQKQMEDDLGREVTKAEAKTEFEKLTEEERSNLSENHNFLTVDYERITPLLIEATKELNSKIEQQAAEIAELKTLLQKLMETL